MRKRQYGPVHNRGIKPYRLKSASYPSSIKLTFGRYRGVQVHKVPTQYLEWLLREAVGLIRKTRKDICRVLEWREKNPINDIEQKGQCPCK